MIRVALVDDHRVVTRGLRMFLESFPDIQVAGVAASGEELLAKVAEWNPQIVVMDLFMPGGLDGVESTRRLREAHPAIRVIALTASVDEARLIGVLRAGASGYIRKDADPELLLSAIRAVAQGRTFIDPSVAGDVLAGERPVAELSAREMEVLRQIAFGLTNREIGERLFVGEETVKTHVGRILGKLGLQHRTQLVGYALKHGLVRLEEL
ncbi:Transcriptional regulatory protein LiaR [Candidatus Sulfopaludibacter sp. SbA3]|nr:Transcriptional regulatory protein LiaR [Candidatus Sulfopaludibacter sp. SbA3]